MADEIIKLVGIVAVRHLIIGNRRRQIFRFVDRDVDIGVGMRIAIDEYVTLYRQRAQLTQWPLLFMLAAEHTGPRFNDVFCPLHKCPLKLPLLHATAWIVSRPGDLFCSRDRGFYDSPMTFFMRSMISGG